LGESTFQGKKTPIRQKRKKGVIVKRKAINTKGTIKSIRCLGGDTDSDEGKGMKFRARKRWGGALPYGVIFNRKKKNDGRKESRRRK